MPKPSPALWAVTSGAVGGNACLKANVIIRSFVIVMLPARAARV